MPGGRRFLLTVFKGIGDVVLSTPLVRAIKKQDPANEVWFFTRRASEPVLRHNPAVKGVIIRGDGFGPALSSLKEIRRAAPDVALDFMLSSSSGLFTLLSGAGVRAAFSRPHGFLFYNVTPAFEDRGYTVENRLALLEAVGVRPDGLKPEVHYAPGNAARAEEFLASLPPGGPVVTFDITSPRGHRLWPAAAFARLADLLAEKRGARVAFLSGPGEKDYVDAAMSLCRRRHAPAHGLDLLDFAALSARAAMHVGASSAPMHIAVSQGTPTFTVYGLLNGPRSWGPPFPEHAWAQGDLEALRAEEVFEKAAAHLDAFGRR